jgi:protein-S-isoprenylcysteine O-methyltransferase Ste14
VGPELLRVAAFVSYLAALVVVAGAALFGMVRGRGVAGGISVHGTAGTVLQLAAAAVVTRALPAGALRPQTWELVGMLLLAPVSAWLFVWAQVPAVRSEGALVTDGAYAWVRHPMYLAFLGLLLATGLAVSARWLLLAAVAVYIAGTELRIALEEAGLNGYADYRQRTHWRYLPGLR